jgi:hypothetical protein
MTYKRFVNRNRVGSGGYEDKSQNDAPVSMHILKGDLRRLEKDTLDINHVPMYAALAGVSEEQVRILFDAFFNDPPPHWLHLYLQTNQWRPWNDE